MRHTHEDSSSVKTPHSITGNFTTIILLLWKFLIMWVLGKIRDSVESFPLELKLDLGKKEEDAVSSKGLHSNIITPENIPEFCLPPRLSKRSPPMETETHPLSLGYQSSTRASTIAVKTEAEQPSKPGKAARKPLPFSAEGYGLAGVYESPNTRRKESLLLSKCPVYMFERSLPKEAPCLMTRKAIPKKTYSGFLPLLLSRSISEASSSSESSPASSPQSAKSPGSLLSRRGHLKETVSCPSLIDSLDKCGRLKKEGLILANSSSVPPRSVEKPPSSSRAVLLPLNAQREHVLQLQGGGRVRLSAEFATLSDGASSALSAIRVRVVCLEGLCHPTERRSLNCAVNLCLTPGKLQQQESATIRNCRTPVFNEDFFFTELSDKDLVELQLRLKVVDKAAAGHLRRGTVVGRVSKPLSQLLPLKKEIQVAKQ